MINFEYSYFDLPEYFYTKALPEPVIKPEMIIFNSELAQQLGLSWKELSEKPGLFTGNLNFENGQPFSQAYAGHQFGHFNILGDGRAHILGEFRDTNNQLFDLQLKGSGRTAYSRRGDGRAALGPMLREYILSEAMNGLGIPTTRSLAIVGTGEKVYREHPFSGAVLARVASSHIRVGTFEWAFVKGNKEGVTALADYVIQRHYPHLKTTPNKYIKLFETIMIKQAQLISEWMNVGFIHGVMNTDNMTVSGETIDYGPCAFMDEYDPRTVFSSIDQQGRYAYGNQPPIAHWNLVRLAEAMIFLFDDDVEVAKLKAEKVLDQFKEVFRKFYYGGLRNKFGLKTENETDQNLFQEFFAMMALHKADFTWTFDQMARNSNPTEEIFSTSEYKMWEKLWSNRLNSESSSRDQAQKIMRKKNPAVIARNNLVEEALKAAVENNNFELTHQLVRALRKPFDGESVNQHYRNIAKGYSKNYKTFCGT